MTNMIENSVYECMIKDYEWLLAKGKEGKLYWTGTMTDLCIWTHEVFQQFVLSDEQGRPRRFNSLIREMCKLLGKRIPINPNAFVNMAMSEDSLWGKTFHTRYREILRSGEEHPISRFVKLTLPNYS